MLDSLEAWLATPIDSAPVVLFRILIALILLSSLIHRYRYLHTLYTSSHLYFFYEGFPFVKPLGTWGTHVLLITQMAGCLCLILGWGLPWTGFILFLAYSYQFLICNTQYNNHFYLIGLFLLLFSVTQLSANGDRVPNWHLRIFQFQIAICYFYGALNKCHPDWFRRAMPLRGTFRNFKGETEWTGSFHRYCGTPAIARAMESFLTHPQTALVFSWGGLLLDFFIIPLLIWPASRPFVIPFFLFFTIFNHWFFRIGYFPHVNYASLALFMDPSWSRAILDRVGGWL